jgi:C_GCAxxG_C_C family probable redox protein
MNRSEKATWYFNSSFNCSQSVLAAFAPGLSISEDDSLKIACAFGAGMGRNQLTCGAVTGALMVLGLQHGNAFHDDESKKQWTYALTQEFCEEFIKKNGSLNCRELLLGLDMNDPDDSLKIKELGLHDTHCSRFVKDAVEIIEQISVENE